MNLQSEFAAYLGRMLGRSVAVEQLVTLSSGQQARAAGWLAERGFAPLQLRNQLSGPFTPAGLFGDTGVLARDPEVKTRHLKPSAEMAAQAPAIQAVGIDIQCINEVIPADANVDPKSSGELTAIFTLREISYAQSRPGPRETLGGLFCGKEALRKCDATLLSRSLTEIEILPDEAGRPCFAGYALSISHSGGFAIAVALSSPPQILQSAVPATAAAQRGAQTLTGEAFQPAISPQPASSPQRALVPHPTRDAGPGRGSFLENLFRRRVLQPVRLWRSRATH